MNLNFFGWTIEVNAYKNWQSKLIANAKYIAKNNNISLVAKDYSYDVGLKIAKIKAIRLLKFPYPENQNEFGYTDETDSRYVGVSTISSAKNFVEKYWTK
jgi:hypothetical protein